MALRDSIRMKRPGICSLLSSPLRLTVKRPIKAQVPRRGMA
ncbi:hypothetical protein CCACVL1_19675 [Corchorus capsularis]|uniref:Uncharacterized protein n=1 Tax=Corchorus capsularis TaxID=210143 RepID=A0A1R3HFF8_COCAP|nr:hypothetical protein CCACVL1_19675 [Corchorus capsularis]